MADPPPNLASWPPSTIGVLVRGETYRWGCEDWAVALQHKAVGTHVSQVLVPFEALGHQVRVVLAVNSACGSRSTDAIAREYGHRVALARPVASSSQADGVRAALDLYLSDAVVGSDFLLVLRFDLSLRLPIHGWGLHPQRIGVSSKCEPWSWNAYNCTSDLAFFVPRPLLPGFNSSIGLNLDRALNQAQWLHRARRCCFAPTCIKEGSGHGCYNVLAADERVGFARIGFLFGPPPSGGAFREGVCAASPALQLRAPRWPAA